MREQSAPSRDGREQNQGRGDQDGHARRRHPWSLAMLVQIGSQAMLEIAARKNGAVGFNDWREHVLKDSPELARPDHGLPDAPTASPSTTLTPHHLTWLWDLLSREPFLRSTVQFDVSSPVAVLPVGSTLYFQLDRRVREDVTADLKEPLGMRNGKLGRFELLPAQIVLRIPRDQVSTGTNLDEGTRLMEAHLLGVKPDQIVAVDDKGMSVRVGSVNQAFTVASRRCEPSRASHTGNVFQHTSWRCDGRFEDDHPVHRLMHNGPPQTHAITLEEIRTRAELGTWIYHDPEDDAKVAQASGSPTQR